MTHKEIEEFLEAKELIKEMPNTYISMSKQIVRQLLDEVKELEWFKLGATKDHGAIKK